MKKMAVGGMLSCLLILAGCVHKLDEIRIAPQSPEFAMLIAGNASAFKDGVREKILRKYGPFCEIHVINIDALPGLDTAAYDVVVIMDTCLAGSRLNASLKSFLDTEANRKKTVLSMTAAKPDWRFRYQGVDAITSASVLTDQELFFARIDRQIRQILGHSAPE